MREALKLLEGVAAGQSLAALLGYRIERKLTDAGLADLIVGLRIAAPLQARAGDLDAPVESVAARDVVDGLRLLAMQGTQQWYELLAQLRVSGTRQHELEAHPAGASPSSTTRSATCCSPRPCTRPRPATSIGLPRRRAPSTARSGRSIDAESVGVGDVRFDVGRHDPVAQRLDESHVFISAEGVRLWPVVCRYAWPSELDLMARVAGLRRHERWGGWNREPFVAASTNCISVYGR